MDEDTKAVPVMHFEGVRERTTAGERFQWCPIPLGKIGPRCSVSSFLRQLFNFVSKKVSPAIRNHTANLQHGTYEHQCHQNNLSEVVLSRTFALKIW